MNILRHIKFYSDRNDKRRGIIDHHDYPFSYTEQWNVGADCGSVDIHIQHVYLGGYDVLTIGDEVFKGDHRRKNWNLTIHEQREDYFKYMDSKPGQYSAKKVHE